LAPTVHLGPLPIPPWLQELLDRGRHAAADVEAGLGQCAAQMVGARLFNERNGEPPGPVFGCVTTGEVWQFLGLEGALLTIDNTRLFIDNVGGILAALQTSISLGASKAP
jgi:hypothetical protein